MSRGWLRRVLAGATALGVAGCDLAPAYQPPRFVLPASWQGNGPFRVAAPADLASRGAWWAVFGDPTLDRLERQASTDNPTLQAAAERYTQARDLAAEARAGLFPTASLAGGLSDNRQSEHRLFRNGTGGENVQASNDITASASWVPDFWRAISNRTRAQKRLAQASSADLDAARLSLQAELATDYMALRGLDTEDAVLRQTLAFYAQAVKITTMREAAKIASGLDVARARSQLASTEATETDVLANRAVLQHAIAVLVGVPATGFALAAEPNPRIVTPRVPAGLPSELLQRRPDIAAAEREMAAANAEIGVTRAAFYPSLTLSAVGGFEDTGFNLGDLANSLWTVGATAMLPLFEGGLRRAELQQSWSQYAQTRDAYRATVLAAFQQVEDGLALTSRLQVEEQQGRDAVQEALQAQNESLTLYRGGLDNYLNAVVAQVTALTALIVQIGIETRLLQASVGLVTALGGGWGAPNLPTEDQTLPFNPLTLATSRSPRPTGAPDAPGLGPEPAADPLTQPGVAF